MDSDLVLLRISKDVWVNPREITAVVWDLRICIEGPPKHVLCVYHPAATGDYFLCEAEFEERVVRVLGVARD